MNILLVVVTLFLLISIAFINCSLVLAKETDERNLK